MSMNSDELSFPSSEYMDCILNMEPENTFQPQSSVGDVPNDHCNFVVNYPVPPPLPWGGYEGLMTGVNNSYGGDNQSSPSLLNGEGSASGGGTKAAAAKQRRSQRKCKLSGSSSSMYRGVTKYENGRCEAFVWDNTDPQEKSRTTYVGGYEVEEDAARAYDLAALKLWGVSATLNFPLDNYLNDLEEMKSFTKKDYFFHIRRNKTGLAKTVSSYRGVTRNAHSKKWQVRLGKGKDIDSIYVGTFDSEEDAAEAYDLAAIRVKGANAMTNFDKSNYNVQEILESPNFLIDQLRGASKTLKHNSVDDVLHKRRKTRSVDNVPSYNPGCFTPIAPTLDSSSSLYQLPILPPLRVPRFDTNPGFINPQFNYGVNEPMEQPIELQPSTHELSSSTTPEFQSQQQLEQTQSFCQLLEDNEEHDLVAELNSLADISSMEEFLNSELVPEASFEMIRNDDMSGSGHGDGSNEGGGNVDGSVVRPGNSDSDPLICLDRFLMS